jgi:hypothetical protein
VCARKCAAPVRQLWAMLKVHVQLVCGPCCLLVWGNIAAAGVASCGGFGGRAIAGCRCALEGSLGRCECLVGGSGAIHAKCLVRLAQLPAWLGVACCCVLCRIVPAAAT